MIHFLTGGAWGMTIRRPLEAGTRTLYVMWLAFLPLLIFAPKLYFWADPAHAADKIVQLKHLYLNLTFFADPLADLRRGLAGPHDAAQQMVAPRRRDEIDEVLERARKAERAGDCAYFFTITFCAVDYLMSLDVTWASTIYGFLVAAGQGLSAMAMMVAVLMLAGEIRADGSRDHQEAPARSRQADAGSGDAVGVPVVLAVLDHLVGQSAAGDLGISGD